MKQHEHSDPMPRRHWSLEDIRPIVAAYRASGMSMVDSLRATRMPVLRPRLLAGGAGVSIGRRPWLSDLGWTMKALKENLARRANAEEKCSGAFWEGRFKSVPLLDQAALVACMAYVDLNPIRAQVADRPEYARYTGAYARIQARKAMRAAARLRRLGKGDAATAVLRSAGIDARLADADKASWLTPICVCVNDGQPLSLDDYLTLVDTTGRIIRQGKRGSIPAELAPILRRLDIDIDNWVACMLGYRQFLGAVVGGLTARLAEAERRGLQWMQNRCRLFAGELRGDDASMRGSW